MGRFGIGARVRDLQNDEGVIVGKRKGERQMRYDDTDYGEIWWPKSNLTPIEPAPTATELQVGDRVRFVEDYGRSRTGDEGVITGFWDADSNPKGGLVVELDKGGTPQCYASRVQKIEPAAVATPAEPSAPWEPKVGDRVRVKDDRGGGKIGDECTVTSVELYGNGDSYCRLDGLSDGAEGLYSYRLEQLPVVPAPVTLEVGRFYKTRDGRKVGPAKLSNYPSDTCKWSVGDTWLRQDNGIAGSGDVPAYDIVAEWVEPVAEPVAEPAPKVAVAEAVSESKWKVGDEVMLRGGFRAKIIEVRTPEEIACGSFPFVHDGGVGAWHAVEADGSSCIGKDSHDIVYLVQRVPASSVAAPTGSFIVARLTANGEPRPNVRPRVHASIEAAEAEAQRLADRLGDEFAVYQRVSSKTVDAGPVPEDFDLEQARLTATHKGAVQSAFVWERTKQGYGFWRDQRNTGLTHLGRAILKKWIAEAEATTKEVA